MKQLTGAHGRAVGLTPNADNGLAHGIFQLTDTSPGSYVLNLGWSDGVRLRSHLLYQLLCYDHQWLKPVGGVNLTLIASQVFHLLFRETLSMDGATQRQKMCVTSQVGGGSADSRHSQTFHKVTRASKQAHRQEPE